MLCSIVLVVVSRVGGEVRGSYIGFGDKDIVRDIDGW
jgi:hypothetical protein